MFQVTVVIISVILTVAESGQSSPSCIPDHCTCTVQNTTAIPAQPFNVDTVDWRPIVLATGLGTAASTLILTSMAVWWTWKSSSPGFPTSNKPNPTQTARGDSPASSSDGSWATQRNRHPFSNQEWSRGLDSRGSDSSSIQGKTGKRSWPGHFD